MGGEVAMKSIKFEGDLYELPSVIKERMPWCTDFILKKLVTEKKIKGIKLPTGRRYYCVGNNLKLERL